MTDPNVPSLVAARSNLFEAQKVLRRAAHRPSALQALEHVANALEKLAEAERLLADGAREQGSTWEQIGAVYGVTRQGARQRFGGGDG